MADDYGSLTVSEPDEDEDYDDQLDDQLEPEGEGQDLYGLEVDMPLTQHEPERNSDQDFEIGAQNLDNEILHSDEDEEEGYQIGANNYHT